MRFRASVIVLSLMMLWIFDAGAGEGVFEINQACAENSGCFPGDTPLFPVRIQESGSYRLTSNLTVPDENTTAITIAADDVTLDLNGFAISGPTECTGDTVICSPTGSGVGVSRNFPADRNATVINGTVRGMGSHGIDLGPIQGGRVEGVSAISNGGVGIAAGGVVVQGNTACLNGDDGIRSSRVVLNNMARNNGGDGIQCDTGALVQSNTASLNDGFGLRALNAISGYAGNVLTNNAGGAVSGGTQIGINFCGIDTTCP